MIQTPGSPSIICSDEGYRDANLSQWLEMLRGIGPHGELWLQHLPSSVKPWLWIAWVRFLMEAPNLPNSWKIILTHVHTDFREIWSKLNVHRTFFMTMLAALSSQAIDLFFDCLWSGANLVRNATKTQVFTLLGSQPSPHFLPWFRSRKISDANLPHSNLIQRTELHLGFFTWGHGRSWIMLDPKLDEPLGWILHDFAYLLCLFFNHFTSFYVP